MQKKLLKLILLLLVIISIAVSVSTINLDSFQVKFGNKTYDKDGQVNGCIGDGGECIIIY